MGHVDFLQPILLLLLSAIVSVGLAQKLRLSPILGYFAAGLLVGPYGLGWIANNAVFEALAEIGVAFLLFDIGIHLSLRTLWESRKDFLGLGPFQIVVSSAALGLAAYAWTRDSETALIIGAGLSLSSTAVAMQGLKESHEQGTPLGRSALAVLIAQDIFVVFLMILLPTLGQQQGAGLGANLIQPLGVALFKAMAVLAGVAFVGRVLLRPVFAWITSTRNSEVFTGAALLFILATAWGVGKMGLSLPLGAFLAGLALSESDYCYLVKTEIQPFRGLLLGLFFMTVGMSLNWPLGLASAGLVLALVAVMMTLKALTLWGAARLMGYCQGFSVRLGLLLAQGSEFAFVLLALAMADGLLSAPVGQRLQLAVGLTLALTPLTAWIGQRLARQIEQARAEIALAPGQATRVIITGFDAIAQEIAKALEAEGIDYIAYDGDRERIAQARGKGFLVDYSDLNRPHTASQVSLGRARAVVVLVDEPERSLVLVDALKTLSPELPVYAAAAQMAHFEALSQRALMASFLKNANTPQLIVGGLLRTLGIEEERVQERLAKMVREQASLSDPATVLVQTAGAAPLPA